MNMFFFLIIMLICHYLADFCFTSPAMIRAKADGRNPWPILLHSSIHAVLMGLCLLIWGVRMKALILLVLFELVSHFVIDTSKGLLTARFPILADQQHKPYWMLYGFDQLLHQLVVVAICIASLW